VCDFEELAADLEMRIDRRWFFCNDQQIASPGANWRAEYALFEVTR